MNIRGLYYKLPWATPPEEQLITGLQAILGDGDAIALLPYDDGTFYPKRAYFDKELIGGMGGYETDDGDKIVVDGTGEAVRDLYGVPMLLGVDPTEHAAAVDPIKALIAHKEDIGEWIRVDKQGNVVEAGDAVMPAEADGGGVTTDNMVSDHAAREGLAYDAAMASLAADGDVRKVYDIAPPAALRENGEGEYELDEATHIAVDQSKAADLMPTTHSTVEINTALDKARMEEYDEGQKLTWLAYGGIGVFLVETIVVVVMFLLMNLGG